MSETKTIQPFQSRAAAVAALLVLTLLSGVVHGVLDGRWTTESSRAEKASLLELLPDQVGQWRLIDESKIEDNVQRLLRCYGSTVRSYQHQPSGVTVNVAVYFGPRGPIAVHTPEVCYRSTGTEIVRNRRKEAFEFGENRHELWSVEFSRKGEADPSLDVFYGWSDGGHFVAADEPRFWLTDDLYKIQLAGPHAASGFDPCRSFLDVFLPQLEKLVQ